MRAQRAVLRRPLLAVAHRRQAGEVVAARHDGDIDGQGMPNSTVRPCTIEPSALRSMMPVQALAVCAAAKVSIAAAAAARKSVEWRSWAPAAQAGIGGRRQGQKAYASQLQIGLGRSIDLSLTGAIPAEFWAVMAAIASTLGRRAAPCCDMPRYSRLRCHRREQPQSKSKAPAEQKPRGDSIWILSPHWHLASAFSAALRPISIFPTARARPADLGSVHRVGELLPLWWQGPRLHRRASSPTCGASSWRADAARDLAVSALPISSACRCGPASASPSASAVMILGAKIPIFSAIPATVYGYACHRRADAADGRRSRQSELCRRWQPGGDHRAVHDRRQHLRSHLRSARRPSGSQSLVDDGIN